MSSGPPGSSASAASSTSSPIRLATKATAASPKLNKDNMEMGTVQPAADASAQQPTQPDVPAEDDIMQLARLGDVSAMEQLFAKGEHDATYTDDEGITPLHVSTHNL